MIVQKHVTIGQLIFDKKAMACLPTSQAYPTFSYDYCVSDMKIENLRCFFLKQADVLVGSRKKLVGRVGLNNAWFRGRKALFKCKFYLLFKPSRNRVES